MSAHLDRSAASTTRWLVKCTDVPQFDALQTAAEHFQCDDKLHLRNLCNDSSRCAGLTAVHVADRYRSKIILDYSRQQVTGETMELLFDLADAVGFTERREAFRTGERINTTEDKAVLHHVFRMPKDYDFQGSSVHSLADTILEDVLRVREKIHQFSEQVRNGTILGVTGKPLTNVLVVSTGGLHLGTNCIHEALRADPQAAKACEGRTLHFLSNIDPVDAFLNIEHLDPAQTLVIVISSAASNPSETMVNVRFVHDWLCRNLATPPKTDPSNKSSSATNTTSPSTSSSSSSSSSSTPFSFQPTTTTSHATWRSAANSKNANPITMNTHSSSSTSSFSTITKEQVIATHMVAVASNASPNQKYGIPKRNIFGIWDWIVGRYSVCSAIGLLPLSIIYSYPIMNQVLEGAHDMDEHFFRAPLRDNIPVLLGLLGVWNSTFMGYPTRAILPFSQSLHALSLYVQQLDMESNGKRVTLDGLPVTHPSGEINFGAPGSNCHHAFFQLMHQGRVVPADFIGFMESQRPIDMPGEAVSSHDHYMSNFFAQPDALAYGKTLVDLIQEGVPDGLREHMVFTGNRPSSIILMTRLDPFSIGQLLAMLEHRTAVQGFLWGINSFDQYGIELGKLLAKHVRSQLSASRRAGASVQGFNLSTSSLLDAYLAHGRQREQERRQQQQQQQQEEELQQQQHQQQQERY